MRALNASRSRVATFPILGLLLSRELDSSRLDGYFRFRARCFSAAQSLPISPHSLHGANKVALFCGGSRSAV
jgi:hypothetical protein